MSAKVNICHVDTLNNPSTFFDPFQFEITFECYENLDDDLEWKLIYVGSAESSAHDQLLDSVLVGPIPEGKHKFVFQADAPSVSRLPANEIVGVTVVLLTCSYRDQEFIKIGYYVTNDYDDEELRENAPEKPILEKLTRKVLVTEPRVTRLPIKWDDSASAAAETSPTEDTSASTDDVRTNGVAAAATAHEPGAGDSLSQQMMETDCAVSTDSTSNAAQAVNGGTMSQQG